MQKKWVWEIDFHEPDPSMGKISLHNTKKYAIAGLEEEKAVSDPDIAMKIGKIAEIFEEQACGNILPVGAPRDRNKQQQTGRNRQEKASKKFAGRINKFRQIGHTSAIRQRQE